MKGRLGLETWVWSLISTDIKDLPWRPPARLNYLQVGKMPNDSPQLNRLGWRPAQGVVRYGGLPYAAFKTQRLLK